MSRGSWMVALSLLLLGSGLSRAEDPVDAVVRLHLTLSSGAPEGCTVRIAPGHPGCRFQPVTRRVATSGHLRLEPILIPATTVSADGDCTFAITITEPGKAPYTVRRGLLLMRAPAGHKPLVHNLTVALAAPSVALQGETQTVTR